MMLRPACVVLAYSCLAACSAAAPAPPETASEEARTERRSAELLHRSFESYRFEQNPKLLRRLLASPFGYFRFTNIGFAEQVCRRFADARQAMPLVNLHGDAHVEQYAVTSIGRGLADYDDASSGPAVIDLVRFGVSLRLAARLHQWDAEPTIDAFFQGYRAALDNPEMPRPSPQCVRRLEAGFATDRSEFLTRVEAVMEPVEPDDERRFQAGYRRYVELMHQLHPDLPDHFFELRRHGRHGTGFGSALDEKFLLRIEGPTREPGDDVVLEAKELRDLSGISCITASAGGGAFRILLGQTRIGQQPMRFLAQVPKGADAALNERPFWVQAWLDNYRELDVEEALRSNDELREVAYDVGVQLGRGHVVQIATPFDAQLRAAQKEMLDQFEPRIRRAIVEMTSATLHSWEAFRAEATAHGRP